MSGEDDFGDFGDFESSSVSAPENGADFGDFGDFASPPPAGNPLGGPMTNPDADVQSTETEKPFEVSSSFAIPAASDTPDDFGNFAASNAAELESEANDRFGSFADAAQISATSTSDENTDAFGSFSDASVAVGAADSIELFGSFGSATVTATAKSNEDVNTFGPVGNSPFGAAEDRPLSAAESSRSPSDDLPPPTEALELFSEDNMRGEAENERESNDFGFEFNAGTTIDDEDVREALSAAMNGEEDENKGIQSEVEPFTEPSESIDTDFSMVAASVAVNSGGVESQAEIDAFANATGDFEITGSNEGLDNISAREIVAAVTSAHEASEGRETEMGNSEGLGNLHDVPEMSANEGSKKDDSDDETIEVDDSPPPGHMQLSIGEMQEALSLAATAAAHGIDVNADDGADTSNLDDLAMKMTDHMFGATPEHHHASSRAPEAAVGGVQLNDSDGFEIDEPEVEAPSAEEWSEAGGFGFSNPEEEGDAPVEIVDLGEVQESSPVPPDAAAPTESGTEILDGSDGFGDFDAAVPTAQSSPEMDTPEVEDGFGSPEVVAESERFSPETNSPDTEDAFGAFGDAAVPPQPSPENVSPEADEGFGDFEAPVSSAQASPEIDLPDAEDKFGDFGAASSSAHMSPEMDRPGEGIGFGDFDAAETSTQATTSVNASDDGEGLGEIHVVASSSQPTLNDAPSNEEGGFHDFGAAAELSSSAETAVVEDGFGDFGAPAPSEQVSPEHESPHEEDGFGDFDAAESSAVETAPSTVDSLDAKDGFGDFDTATSSTVEASSNAVESPGAEDEFGDFDAATSSAAEPSPFAESPGANDGFGDFNAAASSTVEAAPTVESPDDKDEFGGFDTATSSTVEIASPPVESPDAEDGFGDFDAPASSAVEAAPAVESPDAEDGFGDFDAAASCAVEACHAVESPDAEDGFGDFDAAVPSSQPLSAAVSSDADEGFGDFNAGASSTMETSSAVNLPDDEDGFGNFDDATTTVASDQQNVTGDATEEDDFGDFGGSDQTVTAATSTEVGFGSSQDAGGEDDEDDFGDFGSSEAVAAPITSAREDHDDKNMNKKQPATVSAPTAVSPGNAPSKTRMSWEDIDSRPVSTSLSPAAMQIAMRASAVFGSSGDANAVANDKEVVAVMRSATWNVTENEKRLASMASAQSKTDLPEWAHSIIVNVGLDRHTLADKLLRGGLSPAGMALLEEEDRNMQWTKSSEGSNARSSFDGNDSNGRNQVPTFEDIDELDQRNGWSNSPPQSQFKTPNTSVSVAQPPSQPTVNFSQPTVNSGFEEQVSAIDNFAPSSNNSGGDGGGFKFGSFAAPAAAVPISSESQDLPPPTAAMSSSSSSSSSTPFSVQASSDADFDIFGSPTSSSSSSTSASTEHNFSTRIGSSDPASSSSGLTSADILAGLANYGGGSGGSSSVGSSGGGAGMASSLSSDSASILSQAAQDLLNKLPDLSFMTAKTLVPPTASPMLRNGTPSSLGGVPSSSTYDDPFAF